MNLFDNDYSVSEILAKKNSLEMNDWLRMRDKAQLPFILEQWAPSIGFTQLSNLEDSIQSKMIALLVGDRRQGLPSIDRVFYVEPTAKAKSGAEKPRIGKGTRYGVRNFEIIDTPKRLSVENGVYASMKYGDGAKVQRQRGLLREITEDDYFKKTSDLKKGK